MKKLTGKRNERGAVIVLVTMVLVLLMGALALVVDMGMSAVKKGQLQSAADSAALAAAAELPERIDGAVSAAIDYSERHAVPAGEVSVSFPILPTRVQVRIDHPVSYYFAKALGINGGSLAVEAEAETGIVGAMRGIIPIGVEDRSFVFGDIYMLKRGAGQCDKEGTPGSCSNFGPVALGGYGAAVYQDNIMYGYDGIVEAGQWIPTETGDMVGPTGSGIKFRMDKGVGETYLDFPAGSSRLVFLPIIESLDVGGRSEVKVLGFAAFFIDDYSSKGVVYGRFIRYRTTGSIDNSAGNYNLYTAQLVK